MAHVKEAQPTQLWPADRVERRPVAGLVPSARNARTHSAEQIAQIAASIREFGWTIPALVDEQGTIIAGHGRILAAQSLGISEVPVMVATGWSEAQRRAYVIADNQLALNAGWDESVLAQEVAWLQDQHFSTELLGFDAGYLDELLAEEGAGEGLTDPDAAPSTPVEPATRPGDLWLLGPHRVLCGDSTSQGDVARLCAVGGGH